MSEEELTLTGDLTPRETLAYNKGFEHGQAQGTRRAMEIVRNHLSGVEEAQKTTTGLGMIKHIINTILWSLEGR